MDLVFINGGDVVTDSLTVAEVFEKEHSKVVRSIESLSCSEEFRAANFGVTSYKDQWNREQTKYFIKRDGLVFLIMGFTGEKAAKFKERYIKAFNDMEERLKQISAPSYTIADPIKRAERWIEEQKEKLMLEQQVKENAAKVTYYDTILQSPNSITVTQIAKDYGMSGRKLNSILHTEGIQYKLGGQWLLYSSYQDKGYTKSKTHIDPSGEPRLHTQWTQKGRLFIHQLLEKQGVVAVMDREEVTV